MKSNAHKLRIVMNKICCFIGHRNVKLGEQKIESLKRLIEKLIVNESVHIFLFGSRSNFDFMLIKRIKKLSIYLHYLIVV